jgi:hypothetical protein
MMLPFHSLTRAAAASLTLFTAAAGATAPAHFYSLDNTLADALGGPSLVSQGGTLSGSAYSFDANLGLSLAGALPSDTYTIDTTFTLDSTGAAATTLWVRIIDFKDRSLDQGLYFYQGYLQYCECDTQLNGETFIAGGEQVRVTLSRDGATDTVTSYVNGIKQFSFLDSAGLAKFDTVGHVGHFFIDDTGVPGEASAGSVDYIAIYNTALPGTEIAALSPSVPEPGALALMFTGLGIVGWSLRRR